ncbi:MAG: MFS transporter, partial [Rhodococcus sp. (in: high G+C Gram-positive bacteria)]
WLLMGALFVMGMGMGCTMMPLMTAAIVTLSNDQVARGSTLMNIVQQTAGSIGTAVMSVVLTNQLLDRGLDSQTVAMQHVPEVAAQEPPGMVDQVLSQAADAFGNTFLVATVLIALTLIPAFLLPRKKSVNPQLEAEGAPTVMMH